MTGITDIFSISYQLSGKLGQWDDFSQPEPDGKSLKNRNAIWKAVQRHKDIGGLEEGSWVTAKKNKWVSSVVDWKTCSPLQILFWDLQYCMSFNPMNAVLSFPPCLFHFLFSNSFCLPSYSPFRYDFYYSLLHLLSFSPWLETRQHIQFALEIYPEQLWAF